MVDEQGPQDHRNLEGKIEEAIAKAFVKMGLKKLSPLPSRQTMHLMANVTVTVYETAVENRQPEKEP